MINILDCIKTNALRDHEFVNRIPKNSPMINFYRDKCVFLTGGTGFLGQLFVEKLLRCGVKKIYILVRPKKGKHSHERLAAVYTGPVFENLAKLQPNFMDRIKPVEGDMEQINVGISEQDVSEILHNVDIVLHSAAEVRFDEELRRLLLVNLRGTREILKLCEQIKNLEVFIHISTAYSHCVRHHIEERFYDPPMDLDNLIKFAEQFTDDNSQRLFQIITDRIIAPWPNTYTFTKSLCEELVRRYHSKFPIGVVRPSIIIPTHEDPIPGWINNFYGLTGVLLSAGLGFQRILPYKKHLIGDIVCADFVTNSALAVGWITHTDRNVIFNQAKSLNKPLPDPKIYHVTSYRDSPTNFEMISRKLQDAYYELPTDKVVWIPKINVSNFAILEFIYTVLYHIVPAIFFDIVFKLLGSPIRLMPMYRKAQRFMAGITYFMTQQWQFENSVMRSVIDRMTPEDLAFFPLDIKKFNFTNYSFLYYLGMRRYLLKEEDFDVNKATFKLRCLQAGHAVVLVIYYIGLLMFIYLFLRYFGLSSNLLNILLFRVLPFLKN